MKIRKRDIKVFILGLLTAFLLAIVFDWGENFITFRKDAVDGLTGQPYSAED